MRASECNTCGIVSNELVCPYCGDGEDEQTDFVLDEQEGDE